MGPCCRALPGAMARHALFERYGSDPLRLWPSLPLGREVERTRPTDRVPCCDPLAPLALGANRLADAYHRPPLTLAHWPPGTALGREVERTRPTDRVSCCDPSPLGPGRQPPGPMYVPAEDGEATSLRLAGRVIRVRKSGGTKQELRARLYIQEGVPSFGIPM